MDDSNECRILAGDARDLDRIDDQSIHLIVTSPPYWQLKDYGNDRQIGFDQSYPDYIDHLNLVWEQCARKLHPGCRMCVNVGDQFARAAYYGRYKLLSIQSEVIRFCECVGLDYMGTIIWQKTTTTRTSGGASIMGSFPHPRNGMAKIDYEYILLFKKPGAGPKPTPDQKSRSRLSIEEWNRFFTGHWSFPGVRQDRHLAAFPLELPERLVRMFTFPEETVMDPFCGSGTTLLAAAKWGRRGIGVELVPEYVELARERLIESGTEVTVEAAPAPLAGQRLNEALGWLPYRCETPRPMELQVDPRERTFGTAIARLDRRLEIT